MDTSSLPAFLKDCMLAHEDALERFMTSGTRVATGFATSEPHSFYEAMWEHIQKHDITDLVFKQALFMAPHKLLLGETMSSRGLLPELPKAVKSFSLLAGLAKRVNGISQKVDGLEKLVAHYRELKERKVSFQPAFIGGVNNIVIPANAVTKARHADLVGRNTTRMGISDMHSVHFPDAVDSMGFDPDGNPKIDALALVMTPPNEQGVLSHGPANGANGEMLTRCLEHSDVRLLLYLNKNYPFTRGYGDDAANTIHVDAFKRAADEGRLTVVEDDGRLPSLPANSFDSPDPREIAIASHVVNHIESNLAYTSGRAIQVGFGGTGVLAIKALKETAWTGRCYTEMLEPFTWDLWEAGKIAGSHFMERDGTRTMLDGKLTCTFTIGEEGSDFYERLDGNDAVVLAPASRVVIPEAFHGGLGINNCLAVDFHGHVCAGARGMNHHSGIGGLAMINRGLMSGGVAYLCLKSTHRGFDGKLRSSIMPFLKEGTPVSLIGPDLVGGRNGGRFFIATEQGIEQVNGKSQSELVQSLVRLAHPDFRDHLKAEAWRHYRISA